ncbi:RAD52 motif-containing protein 1-like isoform X2 [Sagmatias obliquidens]|uniref:RAD52 motif-containing protein 1-like isoform X2 n=1 Tax=Sagmatias obliquidens TaxID=3371155 RepID=UPI000F444B84|nr:RAD52 motif-containing protein 1-like isoform X2 [Lagenorhynchus obliquidens]
MVELVPFAVPVAGDKTLLVWELSSGPTAEALQFGLLYSVRVFPNAAVAGPGFYGIIKFYSARDAHRAQKACDQKQLFQTSPVKVRLGTSNKAVQHNTLALNSCRCQELANYYFGFNGWSKRIIKLQDLSNLEEREKPDIVTPLQKQSLKFFCALEVVLPSHECRSPGVGMAEEPLDNLEEGSLSFLMKRKVTQKLAIQKAMTDAFQKRLIVVLGGHKPPSCCDKVREWHGHIYATFSNNCKVCSPPATQLVLILLVSNSSCQPCGQREEECVSDFTSEEEEFRLPELA